MVAPLVRNPVISSDSSTSNARPIYLRCAVQIEMEEDGDAMFLKNELDRYN